MQALIMHYNRFVNHAFDTGIAPLESLGRFAEVGGVAAVLGIVVSVLFTLLIHQERLYKARNDLRAALFEIWLYRHDPMLVLGAQKELLKANLSYIRTLLLPLIVALLTISPLLLQAHYRFALKPIPSDSEILLTALLAQPLTNFADMDLELKWVQGAGTLSPSVREPARHQIVWRLQPQGSGKHILHLSGLGQTVEFPLYVGGFGGGIAPARRQGTFAHLFAPRGAPLKSTSGFARIYVDYPSAAPQWMVWLTVFSLLFAFATNRVVRRLKKAA